MYCIEFSAIARCEIPESLDSVFDFRLVDPFKKHDLAFNFPESDRFMKRNAVLIRDQGV